MDKPKNSDSFAEFITSDLKTIREIEKVALDTDLRSKMDSLTPEETLTAIEDGKLVWALAKKSELYNALDRNDRAYLLAGILSKFVVKAFVEDIDRLIKDSARVYEIMPDDVMDIMYQVCLALQARDISLTKFAKIYSEYFDKNGRRIKKERQIPKSDFPHQWLQDIWDKPSESE